MLEDGRVHLSAIGVLAPHLTEANCDELLARATHKSKREVKELVAEIAPKPDVPAQIRKVPERVQKVGQASARPEIDVRADLEIPTSSGEGTASGRSRTEPASMASVNQKSEREPMVPLAPARYKVQFTASAELRDKLERLTALMPEADLAAVIEAAVTEKLERLEAKRYGNVKKPRKTLEEADTAPGARNIPAPVRRFVWKRDGGQCTFRGTDGRRCSERHRLQFHHDNPFARGGDRSADNIRLLCKAHNLYMAEKDYGKDVIAPYRRPADRVCEPLPSLKLRPDAARLVRQQRPPHVRFPHTSATLDTTVRNAPF
jgi:hypothetical protein